MKHEPDLQQFGEPWALKLVAISVVNSGKRILDYEDAGQERNLFNMQPNPRSTRLFDCGRGESPAKWSSLS